MGRVESTGGAMIEDWRIAGSYFEACNCEAICPCRSIRGRPGGASSFGECFGALSWHVHQGHAGDVDLSGLLAVMSLHYVDRVQPSTPWKVVLYLDDRADDGSAWRWPIFCSAGPGGRLPISTVRRLARCARFEERGSQ